MTLSSPLSTRLHNDGIHPHPCTSLHPQTLSFHNQLVLQICCLLSWCLEPFCLHVGLVLTSFEHLAASYHQETWSYLLDSSTITFATYSSRTSSFAAHWLTEFVGFVLLHQQRFWYYLATTDYSHIIARLMHSRGLFSMQLWHFFCSCWPRGSSLSFLALRSSSSILDRQIQTTQYRVFVTIAELKFKIKYITMSIPTHSKWYHSSHLSQPIIYALSSAVLQMQYNLIGG